MTVDTRLHTADELLRMPDDGFRYELDDIVPGWKLPVTQIFE